MTSTRVKIKLGRLSYFYHVEGNSQRHLEQEFEEDFQEFGADGDFGDFGDVRFETESGTGDSVQRLERNASGSHQEFPQVRRTGEENQEAKVTLGLVQKLAYQSSGLDLNL